MKTIVVGGGIAGILAALECAALGDEITLLEAAGELGGLLSSTELEGGGTFDFGAHLLSETGVEPLDALLMERVDRTAWNTFEYLAAGTFFEGILSDQSPFVDARALGPGLYPRGESELLALDEPPGLFSDLEDQCRATYGDTFTEHLFAPVLDKFFGVPLDALAVDAHRLFGLQRLLCCDPGKSRELKRHPVLDDKLAFHSYREGSSGRLHYYPRRHGMKLWIDGLRAQLDAAGATVITRAGVTGARREGSRITALEIESGGALPGDSIVWTIPPAVLLKLAGIAAPGPPGPPPSAAVGLFHMVVDRPPLTEAFYITCYDPRLITFRVTLYQNLRRDRPDSGSSLTVEVLSPPGRHRELSQDSILAELKQMGVFPEETSALFFQADAVARGFPILSTQLSKHAGAQADRVRENLENVLLAGRAAAKSFFLQDVLTSTHRELLEFRSLPV